MGSVTVASSSGCGIAAHVAANCTVHGPFERAGRGASPHLLDRSLGPSRPPHYVWLSKYSVEWGYLFCNIGPKMHLCHVALQAAFRNPRFVHNYKEESFVGRLVKIYASCAKGRYHAVVQKTCLRKWVVGFSILLADLEAGL